jgi:small multidrug resistance family-3 protein
VATAVAYIGAAVTEIAGWFAFWGWLHLGKPVSWLLPGLLSLALFAYRFDADGCLLRLA